MNTRKKISLFLGIFIQICNCILWSMQDHPNGRFSLGTRIFTRKDRLQIQELLWHTQFDKGSFTFLENTIAYGLTKTFGLELTIPWIFQDNFNGKRRSGVGDVLLEAQWHFYPHMENVGVATLGIRFPTGNHSKNPRLTIGTYGWIFDLTGAHSSDYWYASSSFRVRINQRHNNITPGTFFSYELIGGPKIYLKNGAKFHTLCKLNGFYDGKTKKHGKKLFDTDGNIILFGPLISYKKENLIVEGSFQLPIAQQIPALDSKVIWVSIFSVEVTFF